MPKFHNKTRLAQSIPRKLISEGKWYLIPVYLLLTTSELAKEGIENSGSYRFADHIYANKPKGKFFIGKLLDLVLLKLKSAQSLRSRYVYAKEEIHKLVQRSANHGQIDILAVPCGLARELFEVADELKNINHPKYGQIRWYGIDLDQELVNILKNKNEKYAHKINFWTGDALNSKSYQIQKSYDMVIGTGFTEFLDDGDTLNFYKLVYANLKQGGTFFTSGMMPHKLSEYLMKNIAELYTHYRPEESLRKLLYQAGFRQVRSYRDRLQTILIGIK